MESPRWTLTMSFSRHLIDGGECAYANRRAETTVGATAEDAATHLEADLRNVVKYINDEVVPEVGGTDRRLCALLLLNCTAGAANG